MKVCWVKIWIASMATLTERFRDDEGRVDFEALGREEYAFRHALITGDYYKSERARDLAEAAEKDYKIHSENGKKGGRPKKLTAAAPHHEAGDVSANGCKQFAGPSVNGRKAAVLGSGDRSPSPVCEKEGTFKSQEAPAESGKFRGSAKPKGESNTGITPPVVCPESGNLYDQEALDKPTISTNSPAGAGVNLDSTQTIKRPDASSGNAEGVNSHGSPIFLNCSGNGSRAACTSATSGRTISATEALEQPGAGEVTPESVSAKPSPALPVPAKKAHGEFGNVMLTDDEYSKLHEKLPNAQDLITELDQYIESQGKTKKYKSHYATLLNWSRRKAQEAKPQQRYKNINDINQENYEKAMREIEAMCAGEAV